MQKLKVIAINTNPSNHRGIGDTNTPFISQHIVPNTDNNFLLEFHESQYIYLRNIQTGARQVLIKGSPNALMMGGLPCSFFQKCSHGYEVHFCTIERKKGSTIHTWYRWHIGEDFAATLDKYGRLPIEMGFKQLMDSLE